MLENLKTILTTNVELIKMAADDLNKCADISEADSIAGFLLNIIDDLLRVVNAIHDATDEIDTREDFIQTLTIISGNIESAIKAGMDAEKATMIKSQIDKKIAQLMEDSEES